MQSDQATKSKWKTPDRAPAAPPKVFFYFDFAALGKFSREQLAEILSHEAQTDVEMSE